MDTSILAYNSILILSINLIICYDRIARANNINTPTISRIMPGIFIAAAAATSQITASGESYKADSSYRNKKRRLGC
jgi:hypothetical protein